MNFEEITAKGRALRKASAWTCWILLFLLGSHAAATAQVQERAWFVDVSLEGPLGELELRMGEEDRSRLELNLLGGERRSLRVLVPGRIPLGHAALARAPLPEIQGGAGAGGSAEVLGWSEDQSAGVFEALPPGLRTRSIPPVVAGAGTARAGALLLLVLGLGSGLFLRRRPWTCLLLGIVLGAAVLWLQLLSGASGAQTIVLEADLERGLWLEVRAARDELSGPFESLAVDPEGGAILVESSLDSFSSTSSEGDPGVGPVLAMAPGRVLVGRRMLPGSPPALTSGAAAGGNQWGDFELTFLRDPRGNLSAHGAWGQGAALPPQDDSSSADPPGWLVAGLAPGHWIFLGRLMDGRWVRATGFPGAANSTKSH
ncbi:MAG: hypothetical protein ACI8PQ_002796 [Planctomycetota bacterium]|jgi:hypothetical protein